MQQVLRAAWLEEADRRHLDALGTAPRVDRSVQWLPLSALAFLLWQLHDRFQRPLVCVTDGQRTLDQLSDDLAALAAGRERRTGSLPDPGLPPHADLVGDRMRVLLACLEGAPPPVTVATVQGLMSPTLPPDALAKTVRELAVGDDADLQELAAHLETAGYGFEAQVAEKGHAALRGGLLDLWPVTEPLPLRIEFFGPSVETIRTFNPEDQRSVERRRRLRLPPAGETAPGRRRGCGRRLLPAAGGDVGLVRPARPGPPCGPVRGNRRVERPAFAARTPGPGAETRGGGLARGRPRTAPPRGPSRDRARPGGGAPLPGAGGHGPGRPGQGPGRVPAATSPAKPKAGSRSCSSSPPRGDAIASWKWSRPRPCSAGRSAPRWPACRRASWPGHAA